jgi:DNA polymerase/3'-5' exonuclease PolX
MRSIAKNKGIKLSNRNMTSISTGKEIIAKTEKEIFKKLN